MTQVRCPRCQGVNVAPPHLAGAPIACRHCRQVFSLGGPLPSPATAPPVAAQPTNVKEAKPPRWIGWMMRLSLLVIGACLILALVLIPQAIKKYQQAQAAKKKNAPPPDVVEIVDLRPKAGGPIQWIDAVRSAGLRSGINVRITRCEYGAVMARDTLNEPIIAGPGEFLKIHLRVTNRGPSAARYISWHAHHFRDGSESVAARLSDDTGREYPPQRWSGLKSLEGHVEEAQLAPGESIGDVLIFALPAAKGSGESELRLQLPAGAVARTGWFNFKLTGELWRQ